MSARPLSFISAVLLLASCSSRSGGPPAIAEAFAGPATLTIRQELTLQSPTVATVKHGDRLDILQTRRRFAQVRTEQGAVGWIDSRALLSPEQMNEIRRFADSTSTLPSQGAASVVEALNMHTEPNRTSPSFLQLPETASVQVIGHKLSPRTAAVEQRPVITPRKAPRITKKSREKDKASRPIPPPPAPAPPKPPSNWLEMSRSNAQAAPPLPNASSPGAPPAKGLVMEDWSLVRTKDKKVGWVLSRMLSMSIPDDVAQYAEGQRITSYFPLSDIPDEGQTKHAWLWTTISHGGRPFEFDGLRVFVWSLKHHRYETVYRERDLTGYYPVSAQKASGEKNSVATFSIPVEVDGQLILRTYAFNGYRVNLLRKEPFTPSRGETQTASTAPSSAPPAAQTGAQPSWYSRLRSKVSSWFR